MATPRGIRAGRAFVELFADNSKLMQGLRAAEARIRAFGSEVSAIGGVMARVSAVAIGPLIAASKVFADFGDTIAKASRSTGMSVESLSELHYAASQSGTSMEALEKGVRRMQKTVVDAGQGLGTATSALATLGLTAQHLQGLSPEDQFKLLAEQISKIEDPTERAAIAMEIFGRSGTEMLPLMADGAAGIEALQAQARELGLTLSRDDAAAAERLTDALDRLWRTVRSVGLAIGSALAPALEDAAARMTEVVANVRTWVHENRELIVTALKVAAVVGVVGGSLLALGPVISTTGAAVGALGVALKLAFGHPVILGASALVAAVSAMAVYMRSAASTTHDQARETRALREAGDSLRATDLGQIERLKTLAEGQRLTSAEMSEARLLIAALEGKYAGLNVELDDTAGKLNGVAEAQAAVNDALRQSAIAELDKEIAALEKHIEQWGTIGVRADSEPLAISEAKLEALRDRLQRMLTGDISEVTGGAAPVVPRAPVGAGLDVGEPVGAASSAEGTWARRVHQLRLQLIQDEHERAEALVRERYAHESAEAKRAGESAATINQIVEAEALEMARLRQQVAAEASREEERRQEELAREEERRAQDREAAELRIAELQLRTQYEGDELERKLLELRLETARKEALLRGFSLELVEREFALRAQLLGQSVAAAMKSVSDKLTARGTFNIAAAASLGGQSEERESWKAARDTARYAARMERHLERIERREARFL